ncbi:MAG TPA: RDD family protein [Vicinamibacterales bacterium]|nr:RDD family protein [Vicinamibacterales bacterium]
MKCPKCNYLGFETGDRCKNCGYDFSLLASVSPSIDPALTMREAADHQPPQEIWLDRIDTGLSTVAVRTAKESMGASSPSTTVATPAPPQTPVPQTPDPSFPLFTSHGEEDDEPLIKVPSAPRPPLAVRRTPDLPRFLTSTRVFDQDEARLRLEPSEVSAHELAEPDMRVADVDAPEVIVSSLTRRAVAGLIDLAILFGIDFLVVYSTLRMSALTISDWRQLPPVPILAFLALVKLSYFGAFTAACGQTIGKMAMKIRVVGEDAPLDPARAARRTLVSAVSLLAVGAGFIPVLVDPYRRALHDRAAGTRVVELPPV